MSLAISTSTPDGIILAADSRQSYRNRKGMARVGSDSASKLFQISKNVGLAVTGIAFLPEEGILKSVGYFVEKFKEDTKEEIDKLSVEDAAKRLLTFFSAKYDFVIARKNVEDQVRNQTKQSGLRGLTLKEWKGHILEFSFLDKQGHPGGGVATIDTITFMVVGFDKDKKQKVFIGTVPGDLQKKRDGSELGKEFGADWIGQTDVVSRIVLGFDPRIGDSPFVKEAVQKNKDSVTTQLRGLEYVIQWGTMTLQDGVDFSTLIIKTTEAMQRFSDGIAMNPGDMPGVGGEIDIALITAKDGFSWLKQKEIRYEE
jgi:hypothetical protein